MESQQLDETISQSPDMPVDVIAFTPAPKSMDSNSSTVSSSDDQQKRYFCQRCLNHRLEYPRKGHKPHCRYADCQCADCMMVEQRRQLNNELNPRRRDPNVQKTETGQRKVRDPKCARCSAHGEKQALRGHKRTNCPYINCDCHYCKLVEKRRELMAKQIKLRRDQQKARKAQQLVDETESDVRRTLADNFDLNLDADAKPPSPKKRRTKQKLEIPKPTKQQLGLDREMKETQNTPFFSLFQPPTFGSPAATSSTAQLFADLNTCFPVATTVNTISQPTAVPAVASFASFGVDWLAVHQQRQTNSTFVPPFILPQSPPSFLNGLQFPSPLQFSPPTTSPTAINDLFNFGSTGSQIPSQTTLLLQILNGTWGPQMQQMISQAIQLNSLVNSKPLNSVANNQNSQSASQLWTFGYRVCELNTAEKLFVQQKLEALHRFANAGLQKLHNHEFVD
ncbi:hypothetical protein M3Y98_00751900 [Aphelenchoides besseyi]|nr:hypothetical protein M3Y98_00751900 [Aphelenchoides besseyi]